MKRFLYTVFIMVFSMGIITGCGAQNVKDDRISIVCTTFPQYDWVREIIGEHEDRFDITYLLESGVDIHSYQPTAMDIAKITDCDLLIYLGGESEEWVEEVITQNANSDMQVIEMM